MCIQVHVYIFTIYMSVVGSKARALTEHIAMPWHFIVA